MKYFFQFLFVLSLCTTFSTYTFSQTRSIYAKRHGAAKFIDGITVVQTNFGAAPERWVKHARLDKVKLINDSTAVMFTTNECVEQYSGSKSRWNPGADTLVNHPVFTTNKSILEMEVKLDNDYYFVNEAKTVEFEGYEQNNTGEKKTSPILKSKVNAGEIHEKRQKSPLFNKWLILLVAVSATAGSLRIK